MKGKCKHFDSASNLLIIPEYYLASKHMKERKDVNFSELDQLRRLYKPHLCSTFLNINFVSVGFEQNMPQAMDISEDEADLSLLCLQIAPQIVDLICDEVISFILFLRKGDLVSKLDRRGKTERIPHFRAIFEQEGGQNSLVLSKTFWEKFDTITFRSSTKHSSLAKTLLSLLQSRKWRNTRATKQATAFLQKHQLDFSSSVWISAFQDFIGTCPTPHAFLVPHKTNCFILSKVYSF